MGMLSRGDSLDGLHHCLNDEPVFLLGFGARPNFAENAGAATPLSTLSRFTLSTGFRQIRGAQASPSADGASGATAFIVKRAVAVLFLGCMCVSGQGQYRNVLVVDSSYAPEEPAIVVNPNNPLHMVAGANDSTYARSTNGGLSWSCQTLQSGYGVWGDPCVVVDANNSYYFFHLSFRWQDMECCDRIVCQKLETIDAKWSDGAGIGFASPKVQDKEWAAVDHTNNRIYVAWTQRDARRSADPADLSTIRFSASCDGGQTWSDPVRINQTAGDCLDSDNTVVGAVPAVGLDGEVFVSWSGPAGIVLNKSSDGGTNWLDHNIAVSDQPGGWDITVPGLYRCNGLPVTACDVSAGPQRGTVYVNWADQRNGTNDTDIWLAKSADRGLHWTAPKRVNDDPPGRHQFFTWMTIDQSDGSIYVVFYDRRNYADDRTDVYLATSRDGGETFINTRISESPFTPDASVFFGDYNNISAHNGVVRPIWSRMDRRPNGVRPLSVWTAIINRPPAISQAALSNGIVSLSLTNLTSYLTNHVQRTFDITAAASWVDVDTFTGIEGSCSWSESAPSRRDTTFYRVTAY